MQGLESNKYIIRRGRLTPGLRLLKEVNEFIDDSATKNTQTSHGILRDHKCNKEE